MSARVAKRDRYWNYGMCLIAGFVVGYIIAQF